MWIDDPYSQLDITYCLFEGNTAMANGGAIYISAPESQMYSLGYTTFDIKFSTFHSNKAGKGGAIYSLRYPMSFMYAMIEYNSASISGGAIYLDQVCKNSWAPFAVPPFLVNASSSLIYISPFLPQVVSGCNFASIFLSNNLCEGQVGGGGGMDPNDGYGGGIMVTQGSKLDLQMSVFNQSAATRGAGKHSCEPSRPYLCVSTPSCI